MAARVMIVKFKNSYRNPTGVGTGPYLLNVDELLVAQSGHYVFSPRNPDYLDRFSVLYDETFPLLPISATQCGPLYVKDFVARVNKTFTLTDAAGADATSSTAMLGEDICLLQFSMATSCCAGAAYVTACYKDM